MTTSPAPSLCTGPAGITDEELYNLVVSPLAACAGSALDPDEWFPITAAAVGARAEASGALAVCGLCPVRAECLELSLRHWRGVGRHGVWGGLVEADREVLRRKWLKGVPVTRLLSDRATARRPRRPGRAGRPGRPGLRDVTYQQLPLVTVVALALLPGIFWIVNGAIEIFAALSYREMSGRGWAAFMGVLSIIAVARSAGHSRTRWIG